MVFYYTQQHDEYDGVFEALYEKYGKHMAELQLVCMVGTSAAMYHLLCFCLSWLLSQYL